MCHDTGIPERRIFRLLFFLFVFLRFVPMFYKNFDATMQKFLVSHYQGMAQNLSTRVPCSAVNPFSGRGSVALVCDFEFGPVNADF